MQDRIMSTEDSVSMFIREMNELLDSHEISTNLGIIAYYIFFFPRFRWEWVLWITTYWILIPKIEPITTIVKT
mgnify:CR=1 FL=1